jgi:predicted regulator of Ras-like GTPase activity (Roadblock/LC7/MglB family)
MDSQPECSEFETILQNLNTAGSFVASIIASHEGLPVAVAPTPPLHDPDTIAAMVTMVKEFIQQTQVRLSLAEVDEVSIVVRDRSRIVCRYFDLEGQSFVLAVMTGPNASYRRLTNAAVREIQKSWQKSAVPA